MAKRDYYEILGVSKGAGDEDIRSAYRRLARKYHPDLNPGDPQAEQKFKELGEAYEALSDTQKRQAYDRFGPEGVRMGAGAGPGAGGGPQGFRYTWSGEGSPFEDVSYEAFGGGPGGPENLFEEIFSRMAGRSGRGGARAGRVPRRGQDLESELTLTFEQAAHGTQTSLTVQRPTPEGGVRAERIDVRVPPGVEDGQRLRLRGQGGSGPGNAPPGDLYLVIRVLPHPYFRREGSDVYLDLPVTVSEAALGATVEVPTISGRTSVHIPPGVTSGMRLRLKGQGLPSARGGSKGDQYCVIKIVPPRQMDERTKRLFEELRGLETENPRAETEWGR